jgi:hypothetical protein
VADTLDTGDTEVERDPSQLALAYEELREAVLAEQPGGWRLGHGVLTGRGVAAWMAARAAGARPSVATSARPSSIPLPTSIHQPSVALSLRPTPEVVAVLAQMALAHA